MNRTTLLIAAFSLQVSVVLAPNISHGAENADSLSIGDLSPSHPLYNAFERYKMQQTTGIALLGAGFGVSLIGAGLTYAVPTGPVGIAGMTTVGVGLATMTTGMCLLAFSRLVWQHKWRKLPGVMFYKDRESTLIGFRGRF